MGAAAQQGDHHRLLEDVGVDAEAAVAAEAERLGAWLGDVRITPRFRTPLEAAEVSGGAQPALARRLGPPTPRCDRARRDVGAGVFAAFGPAARPPGPGCWSGSRVAAVVAYCNATSSAQLAARYPQSGGTYVYGRERLGAVLGLPRRLGLRRRQDRELRGDGADVRGLRAPAGSQRPVGGRRGRRAHRA